MKIALTVMAIEDLEVPWFDLEDPDSITSLTSKTGDSKHPVMPFWEAIRLANPKQAKDIQDEFGVEIGLDLRFRGKNAEMQAFYAMRDGLIKALNTFLENGGERIDLDPEYALAIKILLANPHHLEFLAPYEWLETFTAL